MKIEHIEQTLRKKADTLIEKLGEVKEKIDSDTLVEMYKFVDTMEYALNDLDLGDLGYCNSPSTMYRCTQRLNHLLKTMTVLDLALSGQPNWLRTGII